MIVSNLHLAPQALVQALLDEMRTALAAIESGDLDHARCVLRERCIAVEPLRLLPTSLSVQEYALAKRISAAAPAGLLTQTDKYAIELAATVLRKFSKQAGKSGSVEETILILNSLADVGVSLVADAVPLTIGETMPDTPHLLPEGSAK